MTATCQLHHAEHGSQRLWLWYDSKTFQQYKHILAIIKVLHAVCCLPFSTIPGFPPLLKAYGMVWLNKTVSCTGNNSHDSVMYGHATQTSRSHFQIPQVPMNKASHASSKHHPALTIATEFTYDQSSELPSTYTDRTCYWRLVQYV